MHECGVTKERIYVTGFPMAEVLHQNLADIEKSDILEKLGLEPQRYILLSAHREENFDTEKSLLQVVNTAGQMNLEERTKSQGYTLLLVCNTLDVSVGELFDGENRKAKSANG